MHKTNQLGKVFRLIRTQNFTSVFTNAQKFRHHGINVLVQENKLANSRLGICIPKKQVPRAVDRNRIKRIIRENFRFKRNELAISLDMVFLIHSGVLELSNEEIRACLDFLWKKLTRFCKKV